MDELERWKNLAAKCDHLKKNAGQASTSMREQALIEIYAEAEAIHKKFPSAKPPPTIKCSKIIN